MGVSALKTQSRAIETVSRNMANVNNPTYSRQRVVFGNVAPIGGGTAVSVDALQVEQLRDVLLDRQVTREKSAEAALAAETAAYDRGETAMGETISSVKDPTATATGGGNSLANAMSGFFGAARQLATDPTNATQKQMFFQTAKTMAERFQFSHERLTEVQSDLTDQCSKDVEKANLLLSSIKDLNASIASQESSTGQKALSLRDERQARLEDLSQIMSFRSANLPNRDNQIEITATSATGADTVLLSGDTTVNSLSFNGDTVYVGSPSTGTALNLKAGSITGNLTARDGALQTLSTNLDQMASQMVTSVNAVYNPSGTTQNFFNPTGKQAGTITLATGLTEANIRASAPGGAAGDGSVAQAISELDTRTFSTDAGDAVNGTLGQSYASAISLFSYSVSQTKMQHENQKGVLSAISGQRDSVSGVSLDEEAAELMKYQRAFQASARILSLIDNVLETVVNGLGR